MEEKMENEEVQSVGEMLRNARVKQKLTIEDIAAKLCIRRFYLNAIEEMDFANIPPMPYGLGFVRSYAKFLGLNSDRIVASYRQMMNGGENPKPQHESKQTKTSAPRFKHIVFGFLGLAVLVAAWSVLPTTSRFEDVLQETAVSVPEPVIVEEENEQIVDGTAEVEAAKSEENSENKQPESAEKNAVKDEVKADNTDAKEVKSATESADEVAPITEISEMKVVLSGPSWLEVRHDKKVLLSGVYSKGYTYTIPAQKGMQVSVGRPRNVKFYIGDEQVVVASNLKRTNISLDKYFKLDN